MTIAEYIASQQDVQEMTRKAIKMLLELQDPIGIELSKEYEERYGESV